MKFPSEKQLLNLLPNGSGIDCNWEIEKKKNTIVCSNYFHAMNEVGYYDGYMPFKVTIFKHKKDVVINLKGICAGQKQILNKKGDLDFKLECNEEEKESFFGLKDYLEDAIYYSLEPLLK